MESMIFKWGLNEVSMRSQWGLKWDLIRQAMVTLKIRPHMDFHQTSWDLIRAPGVLWNTMYSNELQCIVLRCIAAQSVECNVSLSLLRGGVGIPPPPKGGRLLPIRTSSVLWSSLYCNVLQCIVLLYIAVHTIYCITLLSLSLSHTVDADDCYNYAYSINGSCRGLNTSSLCPRVKYFSTFSEHCSGWNSGVTMSLFENPWWTIHLQ